MVRTYAWLSVLWLLSFDGACATPPPLRVAPPPEGEPSQSAGGMSSERMEEIQATMRRVSQGLSHCWSEEATRTNNPKLTVDMMVKMTIEKSRRPTNVEIT